MCWGVPGLGVLWAGGQQAERPGTRSSLFTLCMKQNMLENQLPMWPEAVFSLPGPRYRKLPGALYPVPGRPKERFAGTQRKPTRDSQGRWAWWAHRPRTAWRCTWEEGRGPALQPLAIPEGREWPAQPGLCRWKQRPPACVSSHSGGEVGDAGGLRSGEGRVQFRLAQTWAWPHWLAFLLPLETELVQSPCTQPPGRAVPSKYGQEAVAPAWALLPALQVSRTGLHPSDLSLLFRKAKGSCRPC